MVALPSIACCLGSGKRRTFGAGFGGAFGSDETDARDHDGVDEILTRDFSGTTSDGTPSSDDACNAYSAGWQLLEERVDSNYLASPGLNKRVQHVWGKRYVDDAILHRQDRPESGHPGGNGVYAGTGEGTWYHVTDAMFATSALLTPSGALAERVTYDAYGRGRHHWPADVNGDGAVTTTGTGNDLGVVSALAAGSGTAITAGGYRAECDVNRDGTIDSSDVALVSSKSALAAGLISDASGADNAIGWQGYVFNPETRLYTVRNRTYEPVLGRWMQRDPAGYVDGMSLYETSRSDPIGLADFLGLAAAPPRDGWDGPFVVGKKAYWHLYKNGRWQRPSYVQELSYREYIDDLLHEELRRLIAARVRFDALVDDVEAGVELAGHCCLLPLEVIIPGAEFAPMLVGTTVVAKIAGKWRILGKAGDLAGKSSEEIVKLAEQAGEIGRAKVAQKLDFAAAACAARGEKTVLGKFPDYINLAADLGARRFNIPPEVWARMTKAEQWAANKKFLDRVISRGDDIVLSNPVKNINEVTGFFRQELDYLIEQGFRLSSDGTRMIR